MPGFTELIIPALIFLFFFYSYKKSAASFDDSKIGQEMIADLRKEKKITDIVNSRVDRILKKFQKVESLRFPDMKAYILDEETVNAAALPGGRILLTKGFLTLCEAPEISDDEMAGVIAHEIAHIELGHFKESHLKESRVDLLRRFASLIPGFKGGWGVNAITGLLEKKLSRNHEFDADAYGVELLRKAGFSPDGLAKIFQSNILAEGDPLFSWINSHPAMDLRIERIYQIIKGDQINS